MSVNLVARTRDGEIQLWQTPTQITYTILPPSLGLTKKGREAREESLSLLYSARPWERMHYTMLLRYLLKVKPDDPGLQKHAKIIFSELGLFG
jgi:hypothetical protein